MECFSFNESPKIYWLIDNTMQIIWKSGEPQYHYLAPGQHSISCLDEGAKVRKIDVRIEEK
ncbi:MAG TPA: hypothetical protein ENK82_06175 [Campylobacterales bacterium]|nr:hypothetical protein [Campylobacterales bacterium]